MILLIDIDSTIPNIALHKVEMYYKQYGETVVWDDVSQRSKAKDVYVSCVFTKNKDRCAEWEGEAFIGGTGYDLHVKLPDEIDEMKPKINYGFTTRGCIRKCPFCFVPEKEGGINIVGDIYDFWDGVSRDIVVMDNNILAIPSHFKKICGQIASNNLRVDFNQGLDIRLLTDDVACILKKIKTVEYRFAFDSDNLYSLVESKIALLKKHRIRGLFYVLVGYDSDFFSELKRGLWLIAQKQRVYIQRYEKCSENKRYVALATYFNSPLLGKGAKFDFTSYLTMTDRGKRYLKYFSMEDMKRIKDITDSLKNI